MVNDEIPSNCKNLHFLIKSIHHLIAVQHRPNVIGDSIGDHANIATIRFCVGDAEVAPLD